MTYYTALKIAYANHAYVRGAAFIFLLFTVYFGRRTVMFLSLALQSVQKIQKVMASICIRV